MEAASSLKNGGREAELRFLMALRSITLVAGSPDNSQLNSDQIIVQRQAAKTAAEIETEVPCLPSAGGWCTLSGREKGNL